MTTNAIVNPGELRDALLCVIHAAPSGITEGTLIELVMRQDVGRPAVHELHGAAGGQHPQDRLKAALKGLRRHAHVRYEDGTFHPVGARPERKARNGIATTRRNEVLALIKEGPKTARQIGATLELSEKVGAEYLRNLLDAGQVEYSENTNGTRTYFLPGTCEPVRRLQLNDVAAHLPGTAGEVAERAGIDRKNLDTQLRRWCKQGYLKRTQIQGPGVRYRYSLPGSEEVAA